LVSLTQPNNVTVSYTHNANKDSIKYSTGELYTKTYDAAGLLKQATDPGGTINYFYNSLGKTRRIESPGSAIDMNFNIYGLQDTLKDPNAGKTSYAYNAYGELISQTDPKGTTSLTYDTLGRIKTKTIGALITTYTYDKGTRALGTLTSVSTTNGGTESYTYSTDGLCRAKSKTRSKGTESFTYRYAYDSKGRVDTMTYPAGFAIRYQYDDYSDLTAIYNTKNTSIPIWKMDGVNEKGQLQNVTYGNGRQITYGYDTDNRLIRINVPGIMDFNYHFNDKHQLEYRDEKYDNGSGIMQGSHEVFTYDGVNRLKSATGAGNLQMTYPDGVNDRIASKSDAGTYVYNNLSNHRLDVVNGVAGYLPLNDTISYTAEHMVDTVKENGKTLSLSYGTDNQRFKMEYKENNVLKYTRYYDDLYEKEVKANGLVRHLNYVYTPSGLTAIDVQNTGRDTMYYVYTDYLGSLRCITDSIGNIKQRLSYDAWGNRRDPITGAKLIATNGLLFARGFTGHEHLDEMGLINMNGRMYDPALGVFISPDNFVQAPDNTQNFNRYAYCLNNPLLYKDPSGNIFFLIPGISWSPSGGFDASLSAGIGFPSGLSLQATVGYNFKSSNLSFTVGVSVDGVTAYTGYGTKSGWISGYSYGFDSYKGFSSNVTSFGFNYSQNGGWGGNISAMQFDEAGYRFDPSLSYSANIYFNPDKFEETSATYSMEKNEDLSYNNDNAKRLHDKFFGETKGLVKINADGSVIRNRAGHVAYTYDEATGTYVSLETNDHCDGVTTPSRAISINSISSKVYLGKNAFNSELKFYLVMGHERMHVLQNFYGKFDHNKKEAAAYYWTWLHSRVTFEPNGGYYDYYMSTISRANDYDPTYYILK
jgi:RHS repeat-associated protein